MAENENKVDYEFIVSPGEVITQMMRERNMRPEDVVCVHGMSPDRFRRIVSGTAKISADDAKTLEAIFGMSAASWMFLDFLFWTRAKAAMARFLFEEYDTDF